MTRPVFSRAAWGISCALRLCRTLDSAFGQIILANSIPLNPGLAKACVSFQAARLGVLAGIRLLNACHWARCRKTLHRFCGIATQPQGTAGEALHSKASPALSQLPERIWAIHPVMPNSIAVIPSQGDFPTSYLDIGCGACQTNPDHAGNLPFMQNLAALQQLRCSHANAVAI